MCRSIGIRSISPRREINSRCTMDPVAQTFSPTPRDWFVVSKFCVLLSSTRQFSVPLLSCSCSRVDHVCVFLFSWFEQINDGDKNDDDDEQQQASAPRAARRYAPPPCWWQFDAGKTRGGSTSVRGRVYSPHISGGRRWLNCRQPACLLPRQLRRGTDRRTDRAIPKCPSRAGVITMHSSLRGFREREREREREFLSADQSVCCTSAISTSADLVLPT